MATVTKIVDGRIESTKRYQFWSSSENADDGTAIATGDIFMIEKSLGKPAKNLIIRTGAITALTIRLNSQVVAYPLRDARLNWPVPQKDLSNPIEWTDSTMTAITVEPNEIMSLSGFVPISDIQIVSFTAGGATFSILVS